MAYFTSIFHEEVIPVNEFKSDIAAYHANRLNNEKKSGTHDKDYYEKHGSDRKSDKSTEERFRDKGAPDLKQGEGKADMYDVSKRMRIGNRIKENNDNKNKEREKERAERKAQKESFLPEIELI